MFGAAAAMLAGLVLAMGPELAAGVVSGAASAAVSAAVSAAMAQEAEARGAEAGRAPSRLSQTPVFEMPALNARLTAAARAANKGDPAQAARELQAVLQRQPGLLDVRFALARLLARFGAASDAMAQLERAFDDGLRDAAALERAPAFETLRGDASFQRLLERMREAPDLPDGRDRRAAVPAVIDDRVAVIGPANTEWLQAERALQVLFAAPAEAPRLTEGDPGLVTGGRTEAERLVNLWHAAGEAAGNHGDFYENRDGDHSPLDLRRFAQLTALEHAPDAEAAEAARGVAEGFLFNAGGKAPPVIGNSSTAIVSGPLWRSMARLAMTDVDAEAALTRQWLNNQLYVYPEHNDHDPFYGDVFPALTPYMIVTQGSSFSDKTALRSLALMLAALRPETKARMVDRRLAAPTLQMLWRRGQAGIETDADYLSARAHPTAFDPATAEMERMVRLAHALRAEDLPPAVTLSLVQADAPAPGITLMGDGLSESLLETPAAIARVFRRTDGTMRLVVSAAQTEDPNGRPLAFRWVLLRGDPERVAINLIGMGGEAADIAVAWHPEPTEALDGPPGALPARRVDIAVFADNGVQLSAPAFISVAFPPRQSRRYDADGRIAEVDYDAVALQDVYVDPWLFPERLWRDVYAYAEDGRPLGWRREGDGRAKRFTRHGALVLDEDDLGRPTAASIMRYPQAPGPEARSAVRPTPTRDGLLYDYDGPQDRQGVARQVRLSPGDLR
ncbi:MAG: hypothetical protein AAF676_06240 [Pseudomonadota bacterium]